MRSIRIIPSTLLLLAGSLFVVLPSCDKERESVTDATEEIQQTKDQLVTDALMDDIEFTEEDMVTYAADSLQNPHPGGNPPNWGPCATVTIVPFDTITWPKTITVDFGPVNCLCNDGKYRRGQLVSVVSAPKHDSLSTRVVTPVGYFVNDHHIEGVSTYQNLGHVNGALTLTASLVNGRITKPNGDTATMDRQRTRVFLAGENTPYPQIWDDIWALSGSQSGVSFNGDTYSMLITSPLVAPRACSWIVSGTREMQRNNLPLRVVDFGNGVCDNIATVTVNGVTHTIYLP
ncbi:MAG TPA: hypothetical protein P5550_12190 [Bacteroidales bacterium]|nr:hypothetical protein [Bacteroidales bacterium]HRZ76647.1 hypothetical protein [Bacteroidales bacterium]